MSVKISPRKYTNWGLNVGDNTVKKIIRVHVHISALHVFYCLFSFVFSLFRTVHFNFSELNMYHRHFTAKKH
jgi:hypothetical protein